MYKVSDSFAAAMRTRPYVVRLTLDGTAGIPRDAVQEIIFRSGAGAESDTFTLGGAVSASVEIQLDKAQISQVSHGMQISVELGQELPGGTEWLPMGVYYVTEPLADDDRLTVKASDALAAKFDREYEPLDGFDFAAEGGVSSTALLVALCDRRGVQVDVSELDTIALKGAPDGFTERQIIGFIAALYGGFAQMSRTGVLQIRTFRKTDKKVTADDYYENGMEKAGYDFCVQWIKCYNEISELTMVLGDVSAQQGIYLESIWMNSAILQGLWEKLQGFSYVPVTELSFFGNPLIDPGDIITMEDLSGVSADVPVMRISHEYDGGIITRVTANGQAETSSPAGPLGQQLRRVEVKAKTYSGIALEDAKKYVDALDAALDQLEMLKRLTLEGTDDAIYMDEKTGKLGIKATAILTGVLDAAIVTVKNLIATNIVSGVLKSKDGSTYFDLDNAEIVCKTSDGRVIQIANGELRLKDENGVTRAAVVEWFPEQNYYGFMLYKADGKLCCGMNATDDDPVLFAPREDGAVSGYRPVWREINGVRYLTAG